MNLLNLLGAFTRKDPPGGAETPNALVVGSSPTQGTVVINSRIREKDTAPHNYEERYLL